MKTKKLLGVLYFGTLALLLASSPFLAILLFTHISNFFAAFGILIFGVMVLPFALIQIGCVIFNSSERNDNDSTNPSEKYWLLIFKIGPSVAEVTIGFSVMYLVMTVDFGSMGAMIAFLFIAPIVGNLLIGIPLWLLYGYLVKIGKISAAPPENENCDEERAHTNLEVQLSECRTAQTFSNATPGSSYASPVADGRLPEVHHSQKKKAENRLADKRKPEDIILGENILGPGSYKELKV